MKTEKLEHENWTFTGGHKKGTSCSTKTLWFFLKIVQKLSLVCLISASARHKGRKFTDVIAVRSQSKCLVQKWKLKTTSGQKFDRTEQQIKLLERLCPLLGKALCLGGCLGIGVCLGKDYKSTLRWHHVDILRLYIQMVSIQLLSRLFFNLWAVWGPGARRRGRIQNNLR